MHFAACLPSFLFTSLSPHVCLYFLFISCLFYLTLSNCSLHYFHSLLLYLILSHSFSSLLSMSFILHPPVHLSSLPYSLYLFYLSYVSFFISSLFNTLYTFFCAPKLESIPSIFLLLPCSSSFFTLPKPTFSNTVFYLLYHSLSITCHLLLHPLPPLSCFCHSFFPSFFSVSFSLSLFLFLS